MARVILAVAILAMLACSAWAQSTCSACQQGRFQFQQCGVNPSPPIRGQNAVLSLQGIAEAPVGNAYWKIQSFLDGVLVNTVKQPTCSTTNCPVNPGPVTFTATLNIPSFAPNGNIMTIGWIQDESQNSAVVSCSNTTWVWN